MNDKLRSELNELLTEWREIIEDRKSRSADSPEDYAIQQGEVKAYSTAIGDIEKLMATPPNEFNFQSEIIIGGWGELTKFRLGYIDDRTNEFSAEGLIREKAIETLKWCAGQLATILSKTRLSD